MTTTGTEPNGSAYNGWTNYETWLVALHINNEQGWQEHVHETLREQWLAGHISDDQPHKAGEVVCDSVQDVLDMLTEDVTRDGRNPFVADMLSAAMTRVDWDALGATFLQDATEQDR